MVKISANLRKLSQN